MTNRLFVISSDNEATDCYNRNKYFINNEEVSLLLNATIPVVIQDAGI